MRNKCRMALTLSVGCALLTAGGSAFAGQHKRLSSVQALAAGAQVQTWNSPQNQGAAAEMDTFEYLAAAASYRCRILFNNTGRALTVARLGVNGTIVGTCTTPVNGTCDQPFIAHAANLLFQCVVATGNGAPVTPGSFYSFAVQRQPVAAQEASAEEGSLSSSGFKEAQQ